MVEEFRYMGDVGNTIFVRSKNLEPLIGCDRLYLKFEGGNPTGTQKDRATLAILQTAASAGYDAVAIATCGNFGASFAHFGCTLGFEVHIFFPSGYRMGRIREIKGYGADVRPVDGTYEVAVAESSKEAEAHGWYNANPGMNGNSETSFEAYSSISREIYNSLGRGAVAVSVPVGNGTTLTGIYMGFRRLYERGVIKRVPAMIAASTTRGNPVIKSFLVNSRVIQDLTPKDVKETTINEPLVNWHSFDGQTALHALYESNGYAATASDDSMIAFARLLAHEEGLNVLPASASSLVALRSFVSQRGGDGTFVAVLTGRKSYVPRSPNAAPLDKATSVHHQVQLEDTNLPHNKLSS